MTEGAARDYEAMTFEELVAELEALTERMASGAIGIEEAARLYEQAGLLHALASERLERVRQRVERLARPDVGEAPVGAEPGRPAPPQAE